MLAYAHPLAAALVLGLLAWTASLAIRARQDRRRRADLLALHARVAPWAYAAMVASAVGDLPAEADARARLEEERRRTWQPLDWRWRSGRATLAMLPRGQAEGLEIDIAQVSREGAVVEVRWDGGTVALRAIWPGETLRLALPVDTRPHLLEVRPLAGGNVTPGAVRLR